MYLKKIKEFINIIDKLVSLKLTKIGFVEGDVNATDVPDAPDVPDDILDDLDELDDLGDEVLDDEGLEDITGSVTTDVTERLGSYGKWILGIIIVIVILIIVVFVYKGGENSDRFYNKATDLHREGQEFHWDGDDETAEELYDKANEFREKANFRKITSAAQRESHPHNIEITESAPNYQVDEVS